MNDLPVTIADIRRAAAAIAGAVERTPTIAAPGLSELAGCEIHLKLETLHRTGSFKERGALNKLLTLGPAQRQAGVVAMSAGNHAQGVAYHARRLGIPATVVMPEGTPFIKIERTEGLGADVVLKGDSLVAAREAAETLAREDGLTFVHPYDDPAVIAGQGTIALELLADRPDLDTIVAPIGGGGLISGIAVAAKALNPRIDIVGVQATLYPAMHRLMRGEDPGPAADAATLAEGIAVKEPGQLTRRIVEALVSDILLVDEAMLEDAVEILLDRQKLVAEGAGAAGLAAILAAPARFAGRRVGIVVSGGNIDVRLLASILMRGLVREGRLVRLRAELARRAGRLVAHLRDHRQARRQYRRGPPPAAVPRHLGQARRARCRRRNPEPASCRGADRRAQRRRLSDPAAVGRRRRNRLAGALDQHHPAAGGRLADLQRCLVFLGVVPAPRRVGVGEFDDDHPLRLGRAFEQISLAAAHQITAAETRDAGRGQRAVGFVSSGIGDLDFGEYVGGHRILLIVGAQHITQPPRPAGLSGPRRYPHARHCLAMGVSRDRRLRFFCARLSRHPYARPGRVPGSL